MNFFDLRPFGVTTNGLSLSGFALLSRTLALINIALVQERTITVACSYNQLSDEQIGTMFGFGKCVFTNPKDVYKTFGDTLCTKPSTTRHGRAVRISDPISYFSDNYGHFSVILPDDHLCEAILVFDKGQTYPHEMLADGRIDEFIKQLG